MEKSCGPFAYAKSDYICILFVVTAANLPKGLLQQKIPVRPTVQVSVIFQFSVSNLPYREG